MEFNLIGEDDLQFIVHPLHPWAAKRKAQPDDIPNRKLIMPGAAVIPTRSSNLFRSRRHHHHPFIEIANEQAIMEFVRLDMGVGILPRWLVAEDIAQGSLVALPLGRRRLKRRWGVLYRSRGSSVWRTICSSTSRAACSANWPRRRDVNSLFEPDETSGCERPKSEFSFSTFAKRIQRAQNELTVFNSSHG